MAVYVPSTSPAAFDVYGSGGTSPGTYDPYPQYVLDSELASLSPGASGLTALLSGKQPLLVDGLTVTSKAGTTQPAGTILVYRDKVIQLTQAVTVPGGATPFISASSYTVLAGRSGELPAEAFGVRATGLDADAAANTTALQAALDYAAALGGLRVRLPQGNTRVTGGLLLGQSVELCGAGMLNTILQAAFNSNYDFMVANRVAVNSSGSNAMFCAVRDLTLDGRCDNQTAGLGYGVYLRTFPLTSAAAGDSTFDPHHVLDNVRAYKLYGDGFRVEGRSAVQATRTFSQFCRGWGFYSSFDTNVGYAESDGCLLGGFYFNNGSIRVGTAKAFKSGTGVAGSAAPGFYFGSNCYSFSGAALEAQNNAGPGYLLQGCRGVTLGSAAAESNWKDPTSDGPGPQGAGFVLDGASSCVIVGSSTQGKQSGTLIGNQLNAVRLVNSADRNQVTLSHVAVASGVAMAAALTSDSATLTNVVTVNGVSAGTPPVVARVGSIVPVSFHANPPNDGLGATGNLSVNLRTRHVAPLPLSDLAAAFSNVYNSSGVEADGPNSLVVRAAVEYPAGAFTPLLFAGKRDVTLDPGGTVWSDALAIDVPSGAQWWLRTRALLSDTTTARYPLYGATRGTLYGEGAFLSASDVDLTTSGTFTAADNAFGFGPSGFRTQVSPGRVVPVAVAGFGDSIMKGAGDFPDSLGWFGRLFEGVLPYQKVSYSSDTALSFAQLNGRRRRLGLTRACTVGICEYGVNDVWNASRSLAQVQADLLTIWNVLSGMGMRVFQSTLTTKTSSTDSWTTSTNQTVDSGKLAIRNQVNAWIRTTPAPLTGYIEVADYVETARDSGLWKPVAGSMTGDGLHPNGNGYTAIANGNADLVTRVTR